MSNKSQIKDMFENIGIKLKFVRKNGKLKIEQCTGDAQSDEHVPHPMFPISKVRK
jgi:hypothetical protein